MEKGCGSIKEVLQPNGKRFRPRKWRVCVSFGKNHRTGKYDRVQRIVRGPKAAAFEELDRIRADRKAGLTPTDANTTLGEFATNWLEAREANADATRTRFDRERRMIKDIVEYIGAIPLRKLGPLDIENFYVDLRRDRIEERGAFSTTTLNMYHRLLKQMLKQAVNFDIILRNPADRVRAPRKAKSVRRSLSIEEFRKFSAMLEAKERKAYKVRADIEQRQAARGDEETRSYLRGLSVIGNIQATRIAMATGMRRGEVVGLRWGNVDLDRGIIHICESITVHGERKDPKSEASKRTITIDRQTTSHLRTWKDFQRNELMRINVVQTNNTPVCCNDMGKDIKPTNFSRWWREFRSQAGFEGLKFHELRHTQATQLIAHGVDIKTVQHRLGHASATLTMNLYAHAIPENDRGASDLMEGLFSPTPNENATEE